MKTSFKKTERGEANIIIILWGLCILGVILYAIAWGIGSLYNRVTDEVAKAQFQSLATSTDIVVNVKSNDTYVFGNPHDVLYDLTVNGKPMTGRCVSDAFSPIICRLYDPTQGD